MDPWRDILAARAQYPLMSSIHRMVQIEGNKLRDTREVRDISENVRGSIFQFAVTVSSGVAKKFGYRESNPGLLCERQPC